MTEIVVRQFHGCDVRMITIDDVLWLFAADVCKVLSLQNVSRSVGRLAEHEKRSLPSTYTASDLHRQGGSPDLLVTQHGASKIIMKSRKAEAEPFVDWVAYELIPAAQEQRVARMPGQEESMIAVRDDQLAEVEAAFAFMGTVVAKLRENRDELVRISRRADDHEGHLVRIDGELTEIKDDIWARKSEIPRKSCRGWAAKAKRDGRLLVEPNDANLLRLGRRVGKLCRERNIEKHFVDDDRHDEVGKWPVEIIEMAARQLEYTRVPTPFPRDIA